MISKQTYQELQNRVEKLQQKLEKFQTKELENSPQTVSILLKAFQYIPKCRTFKDAAKEIFNQCKQLTGAQSGYVALLSDDGDENEVLFLDAGGLPCDVDPNLPMPIRGLREVAYKTKDVAYDNDFSKSPWMKYMPGGHVKLENVLFSPLNIESKIVGVIGIANKPGGFSKSDVYHAKIMGDLAAVALTYARSQDSLRESKIKYRHLVTNLPGIAYQFLLTPNGEFKFIYIGENCVDLFGIKASEIMDDANLVFGLIPQPDADIVHKAIMDSAESLTPYNVEHRVGKRNGGTVWIKASSIPRKLDDGRVIWDGIGLDISERKKGEESLRQAHDHLESRVTVRTKELESSNKKLEELNSALNVLLNKRIEDKEHFQETILVNVKELIEPQMRNLRNSGLNDIQIAYLNALETSLKDLVSPFYKTLHNTYRELTMAEIKVANLIKDGRTTKEIAVLLGSTPRAIDFHRQNLRKKLGLKNRKINLASHLFSLQK